MDLDVLLLRHLLPRIISAIVCAREKREGEKEGWLPAESRERERDRKDARARMYSRKHESCVFVGFRNLT